MARTIQHMSEKKGNQSSLSWVDSRHAKDFTWTGRLWQIETRPYSLCKHRPEASMRRHASPVISISGLSLLTHFLSNSSSAPVSLDSWHIRTSGSAEKFWLLLSDTFFCFHAKVMQCVQIKRKIIQKRIESKISRKNKTYKIVFSSTYVNIRHGRHTSFLHTWSPGCEKSVILCTC